jgi:hypothetical protein
MAGVGSVSMTVCWQQQFGSVVGLLWTVYKAYKDTIPGQSGRILRPEICCLLRIIILLSRAIKMRPHMFPTGPVVQESAMRAQPPSSYSLRT